MDYSQEEISSALRCLKTFKDAYKEENGTINIGDIRDLIDKIDVIEYCVKKQKITPADTKKHFKMFGKMEYIKYCHSCEAIVNNGPGSRFCFICGQQFF